MWRFRSATRPGDVHHEHRWLSPGCRWHLLESATACRVTDRARLPFFWGSIERLVRPSGGIGAMARRLPPPIALGEPLEGLELDLATRSIGGDAVRGRCGRDQGSAQEQSETTCAPPPATAR